MGLTSCPTDSSTTFQALCIRGRSPRHSTHLLLFYIIISWHQLKDWRVVSLQGTECCRSYFFESYVAFLVADTLLYDIVGHGLDLADFLL